MNGTNKNILFFGFLWQNRLHINNKFCSKKVEIKIVIFEIALMMILIHLNVGIKNNFKRSTKNVQFKKKKEFLSSIDWFVIHC